MSDEMRLPEDLAACEARLAAQSLAAPGINRDELMYRAGWAACEAQAAATAARVTPVARTRISAIASWSLTSAAVAASLAAVLTMQWRPAVDVDVAQSPAGLRPPVAVEAVAAAAPERMQTAPRPALAGTSPRKLDLGLLSLRRQALANAWNTSTSVASVSGGAAPAAKTARELMQEFLPDEPARPTRLWPWNRDLQGESI